MNGMIKRTVRTAVIMAAGKGTRFGSRTSEMPKGFIPFRGEPMVERSVENLLDAGIERIIIGTGYHSEWYERLAEKYPQIQTVFSPRFAETNSMETLYRCKDAIGEDDFLLLESDIVYEKKALSALLNDPHPDIMLVTPVTKFQDQYYIAVDENKNLAGCSTDKDIIMGKFGCEPYGELVGIHKISNQFYMEMVSDYENNLPCNEKRGYEYELEDIATPQNIEALIYNKDISIPQTTAYITRPHSLFVLRICNLKWYEIDDEKDLVFAEKSVLIN